MKLVAIELQIRRGRMNEAARALQAFSSDLAHGDGARVALRLPGVQPAAARLARMLAAQAASSTRQ